MCKLLEKCTIYFAESKLGSERARIEVHCEAITCLWRVEAASLGYEKLSVMEEMNTAIAMISTVRRYQ